MKEKQMQMLALACIVIGALVYSSHYSLDVTPTRVSILTDVNYNTTTNRNMTNSNVVVPDYSSAAIKLTVTLTAPYYLTPYADIRLFLDGNQIFREYAYDKTAVSFYGSFVSTPNIPHTVTVQIYDMEFYGSGVINCWIDYTPASSPPTTSYNVTVEATIGGSTIPVLGTYQVPEASTFQVEALNDGGYVFSRFTVNGVNKTTRVYSFTVSSDTVVVAFFKWNQTEVVEMQPSGPINNQSSNQTSNAQNNTAQTPAIQYVQSHADYVAYGLVFFGMLVLGVGVMQRKKRI